MPLLRSSSRGKAEEVRLTVIVRQHEGEPAIPVPRPFQLMRAGREAGAGPAVSFAPQPELVDPCREPGTGGAIRSTGKRAQRAASQSPYKRPLPPIPAEQHAAAAAAATRAREAIPVAPPTTGLSAAIAGMGLGDGPISSRTRERAKAYTHAIPPLGWASHPLPIRRGLPTKAQQQRLVPLGTAGGTASRLPLPPASRAALVLQPPPGSSQLLPPREARAAERKRQALALASTGTMYPGLQSSMLAQPPLAMRSMHVR